MQGATNPAVTDSTNFTFGNDSGAHGAETGLWVTYFGPFSTNLTVTLGDSPVMYIARAISESRVGCVDFMGLLFAWTPAAPAAQVPYTNPMPPLLAQ